MTHSNLTSLITAQASVRSTPEQERLRQTASEVPETEGIAAKKQLPLSAFTIDVEDWYQSCVDLDAPISERVVRNVDRVLEILDERGVKGTFFVQGLVAEAFPRLVESLVSLGHEVQSHGYSHRPLFEMSRKELREEVVRGRKTVEDAAGVGVWAFRAQDFSILSQNLWALDELSEAGYEVDSSIFPMQTRRYGIPGWDVGPCQVTVRTGAEILEVPVAIWTVGRWRVPVAGGGYFRVLPQAILTHALKEIIADSRPAVVYCHPYEFNPNELEDYRRAVPASLRASQNFGRRAFASRVRRLLATMPFGRFDEVLRTWGLR
jgi:polysaccharide deacetylase family protein (PEP-CTERM system associated)